MPFTLAHPAVVLFTPKSKPISNYLHKPALIIGSMSPDFVYFLAGIPSSKIGHTWLGFFTVNLPLCFVVYYLYHYLIFPYFWRSLPKIFSLKPQVYSTPHVSSKALLIFVSSSLSGMVTHIGLDTFTHASSSIVKESGWLQMIIGIDKVAYLPIYKWFQYTGGVLGLAIIGLYVLTMAYRYPANFDTPMFDKLKYWTVVIMVALCAWLVWHSASPITINGYGFIVIMVIRLIDVGFIGLLITGFLYSRYEF